VGDRRAAGPSGVPDVIFVASMEAANAPPGLEIERHMKDILADAGLWPAG